MNSAAPTRYTAPHHVISCAQRAANVGGCRPTRSLAAPTRSPVLSRGMDRANNIFDQIDTDKSGGIDKGEITIHLLSLGQEQETVMEMFALLDADNDGLISREEFVNGFQKYQEFCKLSTNNRSGKASAKAPPPSFAALIAAGTVVPDEHDGPYALRSYHANVTPARIEGTRARRATTRGSPPTRR